MATILVLDDEQDSCNLLKRIAEGLNHTAWAFTDERDAIEYGKMHRPDLVILDLKLKRLSGLTVFEELRSVNPALKGLILTGYPTPESAKRAMDLGIVDYLIKPVDVEVLEAKIIETVASLGEKLPGSGA